MTWTARHFKRHEFACNCGCGFDTADHELVNYLDDIHERLHELTDRPIRMDIESGCRCPYWNEHESGSDGSLHLFGRAADVKCFQKISGEWVKIDPAIVHEVAESMDVPGLGGYRTFTHVDTRSGGFARW